MRRPDLNPTCIALDNERRGLFCANQVTHGLPELSLNAGSVVVCERTAEGTYSWLVDGAPVASVVGGPTQGRRKAPMGRSRPYRARGNGG